MVDICYPPGADWTCQYTQAELDAMRADPLVEAVMDRSEALAWMTLQALTGYRLSPCPIAIRPCLARCMGGTTWDVAPVLSNSGAFQPYISSGSWYNGCGCSPLDCSCTSLCEILLPTEVGDIFSVSLDGAILDPDTDYRVDNGRRLVRMDGECWPSCQDMSVPADDADAFVVTYYQGVAPNDLFRYAAGVLATEYFLSCSGKECRLPTGVTNITRAGIVMTIEAGSFPGGMTGIPEVDAVIRIYNPYALKSSARVLSPDVPRGRIQTWGP